MAAGPSPLLRGQEELQIGRSGRCLEGKEGREGEKSVEAGYAKDELLTIEVTVKYSQLHIDKSAQNASFNGMHDRGKLPCSGRSQQGSL